MGYRMARFVPKEEVEGEFRRQEILMSGTPTPRERGVIERMLGGYSPHSSRCNSYEATMFRRFTTDPTQQ